VQGLALHLILKPKKAQLLQLCSSELQHIEWLSCFRKILTLQGFDVWAGRVDANFNSKAQQAQPSSTFNMAPF